MGMTTRAGRRHVQSEINVTPMVDIMLVLLIIFIVVTPFLQPGIMVLVPNNMTNPDVDPKIVSESSIVISIPNDVEYYLGKKRVRKEQLGEEVKPMLEKIKKAGSNCVYQERRRRYVRRRSECNQRGKKIRR